ncbi:MAG: fasciclin domain-containing protein [Chloroflexi bacterium]|nr:fasciclin domain-containing protein [Chloroflexota bacterium]
MKKFLPLSLLLVFALILAACGSAPATEAPVAEEPAVEEEPMEEPMEEEMASIVDIAVGDERFSTLVTALTEAGLVEALQGEGPFTVFAPTDDAFAALPEGALEGLLADTDALSNVLLYHVVEGKVLAADVVGLDGVDVETLSGDTVAVSVDGDSVQINDSNVIITDIEASNGVIHVIDAVLLPGAEEAMDDMEEMTETIVDIAVADENFSTLVTALSEAGLVEALQGEGPFTVFAPTNDAFAALPEGALDSLLADTDALSNVLLFHVAEGKFLAEDVVAASGQTIGMLNGQYAQILAEDGVTIAGAPVRVTDIQAANGVIHVIDAVMLPPESQTIADVVVADSRFSTLLAAVDAAGLVPTLSGEGSFTVFAPTDDAFAALPEGTLDGLLADIDALTGVLLYHVLDGEVLAETVVTLDGEEVATLNGANITISIDGDSVKVNDANVIITDIQTDNGVIHVIDAVLVP